MTTDIFIILCVVIAMTFIILYLRQINKRLNIIEKNNYNAISDTSLKNLIDKGKLVVTNINDTDIQPSSIDIRVSNDFLRLSQLRANIEGEDVDIQQSIYLGKGKPVHYESYNISDNDWFEIKPGEFVLASARSYLKIPTNIIGIIEGKYSIGRQGLLVQNTGIIDPGYEGKITLELYNITKSNIYIKPGQNIAQIVFFYLDKPANNSYNDIKNNKEEGE